MGKDFWEIIVKPFWKWVFFMIPEIIGAITYYFPDLQLALSWPTISSWLPWYWWVIIGVVIWGILTAYEAAKKTNDNRKEANINNESYVETKKQSGGTNIGHIKVKNSDVYIANKVHDIHEKEESDSDERLIELKIPALEKFKERNIERKPMLTRFSGNSLVGFTLKSNDDFELTKCYIEVDSIIIQANTIRSIAHNEPETVLMGGS